jgi:hypothetical protein
VARGTNPHLPVDPEATLPVSELPFPAHCNAVSCGVPLGLIIKVTYSQCQVRLRILQEGSTLTKLLGSEEGLPQFASEL